MTERFPGLAFAIVVILAAAGCREDDDPLLLDKGEVRVVELDLDPLAHRQRRELDPCGGGDCRTERGGE